MTEQLTPEQLAAIKKRYEAASVGPWKRVAVCCQTVNEIIDANEQIIIAWSGFDGLDIPKYQIQANVRFIAASRTDVGLLLAEVQRLTKLVDQMKNDKGFLIEQLNESSRMDADE